MSLRFLYALLPLVALLATPARAQIEMIFRLDYSEAIELEPVLATVTLINRGDQPKRASTDYRLSFDVKERNGIRIKTRNGQVALVPDELPPGGEVTFTNNLAYLYQIDQHGQYSIAARLTLPTRELVSERVFLDVLKGVELVALETESPDGSARRYSLRQVSRNRQSRLYFRVDDPSGSLCYGVYDLGRHLSFQPPSLRVDGQGLVHILHLTAPTLFLHSVFSPTGELVAQQTHSGDASSVRLAPDAESGFRVLGVGVSAPRDPFIDTLPGRKHL